MSSRSRFLRPPRVRFLLPPSLRSRSCCCQGQGPAAAINTEIKVPTAVKIKIPAAITKVKMPAAAGIKVEKTTPENTENYPK